MGEATSGNPSREVVWKPLKYLVRVEKVFSGMESVLNYIGMMIIMLLMLFAASQVVGRYVFNRPIPGYVDIADMAMAVVVFLGLAYTQRVGGHIRMELFITGVLRGRAYYVAEFLGTFLSLLIYIVIAVYSLKDALFARDIHDVTMYFLLPIWPAKLSVAIGSFVLCGRFTIQMFQYLAQSVAGAEGKQIT